MLNSLNVHFLVMFYVIRRWIHAGHYNEYHSFCKFKRRLFSTALNSVSIIQAQTGLPCRLEESEISIEKGKNVLK